MSDHIPTAIAAGLVALLWVGFFLMPGWLGKYLKHVRRYWTKQVPYKGPPPGGP